MHIGLGQSSLLGGPFLWRHTTVCYWSCQSRSMFAIVTYTRHQQVTDDVTTTIHSTGCSWKLSIKMSLVVWGEKRLFNTSKRVCQHAKNQCQDAALVQTRSMPGKKDKQMIGYKRSWFSNDNSSSTFHSSSFSFFLYLPLFLDRVSPVSLLFITNTVPTIKNAPMW